MRKSAIGRSVALLCAWLLPLQAYADAALDQRIDAAIADFQDRVADVPTLVPAELLRPERAAPAAVFLDVRTPAERAVSVIPGALSEVADVPAGSRVVVYCTVGLRSGLAARALRAQGIDAYNLRGGVLAWLAAGGTVVDPAGVAVRRVHVYGRRWDLVPADVEAIW